jgi:hypothetical protein
MQAGAGRNRVRKSVNIKLFYSDSDSSNLLCFILPLLCPSSQCGEEREEREGGERRWKRDNERREASAYTLYDCSASQKFVSPNLLQRLTDEPKTRHRDNMQLSTAGRVDSLPLKEVHLNLNIGGIHYVGWFVVYPLAKYDIILGKDWMEEVPHHVNHKQRRLWLGGNGDGSRFKYSIDGLRKDEGRNPKLSVVAAETPTQPQGYNAIELLAMEFGAELVDQVVMAEIVDEAMFKADCAVIWTE